MAISRAQLVKELEPGLNALFGLEYKRYENQHAEIYVQESSDRAFEEEVMLSGFANADVKPEGQVFLSTKHRKPTQLVILMTQLLWHLQSQKKLSKIISTID